MKRQSFTGKGGDGIYATWERITKSEAKKLHEHGQDVYALPCKMNPCNFLMAAVCFSGEESFAAWTRYVAGYCGYRLGYYLSYWRRHV